MKSRAFRHRRPAVEPGINLIPMLDILLFLIFFFIVATNIKTTGTAEMQVTLPSSTTAGPSTARDAAPVLTLDAEGRLGYEGRIVVEEELRLELDALVKKGVRRVRLRADENTRHGRVINVEDICREAGILDVVEEFLKKNPASQGGGTRP